MSKTIKMKLYFSVSIFTLMVLIIGVLFAFGNDDASTKLSGFNNIAKFIEFNKYTLLDSNEEAINQQDLNTSGTIINTKMGQVYLDLDALSFQFINNNGYIWSSTINYESSTLSPNWRRRARSAVHIESFNINSNNYAITEEFVLSEGTTTDTKIIENGFESRITFGKSRIKILFRVLFTNEGIIVEIPNEHIDESSNFKLASIKVYPFFGAVLGDQVPGYVFVPDGIGALVRYQKPNQAILANYQKEFFGRNIDYNIENNLNDFAKDGTSIYAPVFGFVHGINQNAIFGNVISGAEYGMLNVYYSGKITDYTTVFPEFVYRRTYRQPIDKAGNTITLLQNNKNNFDIKVLYSTLEDEEANYVGMAKTYRNFLEDKEGLKGKKELFDNIPLKIETIGLVKNQGLLFNQTTKMTSFGQFKKIIADLNNNGISNIVAAFAGFSPEGATWSGPKYTKVSKRLGSKKELTELINSVNEFYVVGEFVKASSKAKGYSVYSDLAKKINDQTYQYKEITDLKYLLEHQKTVSAFNNSSKKLTKYGIYNFALPSIGNTLYSDYVNETSLKESINIYQKMLDDNNYKIALYDTYSYLWSYLDSYFDFPMYSSQYLQFTDTVPFLSIVLKGIVDLYGASANFYPYARDDLLRLIDFGVYPSFIITYESSKKLQKSNLNYIYSSRYSDLKEAIITYYDFVNFALKFVVDAKIVKREVLSSGVVKIVYDNNTQIIVNYTDQAYYYKQIQIQPKNYIVLHNETLLSGNYPTGGYNNG